MDTTSLKGAIKPTIIQLKNGKFRKDGAPAVVSDGRFHRVKSDGYVDEVSITVNSDRIVREVDRIRGKLAYKVEYVVSSDGTILTWNVASYTNPNGQAVRSVTVQRRVGSPSKGVHLISGKWERASVSVDSKSDWILTLDGNRFVWRIEYGTGYDAVIGGPPVKIDGDSSGALALITRPQPDTIVETDLSKDGKEREAVLTMQMLPDGNTIQGTALAVKTRRSQTFYLRRVTE
jgi:hypothetical protein